MKHPSDWTETQRKRFLILVGLLLVAALFLVGWLVGEPMLRLASDPEAFRQWIAERQTSGLLLYGGMVCFQVFFAIIPGEPLEIAGGYAFGALWGTIACLAAATIGSFWCGGSGRVWWKCFSQKKNCIPSVFCKAPPGAPSSFWWSL